MNNLKKCLRMFSHSPFKTRLMLINMLYNIINSKHRKQQDES